MNKKGYWIYSNVSGNLTLPSVGGTASGQTYDWSDLRFMNSSGSEMNVTDAVSSNWLQEDFQRYEYVDVGMGQYDWRWVHYDSGDSLESWAGYFIYSNVDNLTLIRQN